MNFKLFLKNKFTEFLFKPICRYEYKTQKFLGINERPVEYRFVFNWLLHLYPLEVLDIGTGISSLPHLMRICGFLVTAIDNIHDYWFSGMFNRHYYIINDDITNSKIKKKFDFITCISTLEHIKKYNKAVESMFSLLKADGHLILTFPYNEEKYIGNVYKLPEAGYGQDLPYICQVFSKKELRYWLEINNGNLIEQQYWQIFTGDYWTFGKRISPPHQVDKHEKHQLTCILIQKKDSK